MQATVFRAAGAGVDQFAVTLLALPLRRQHLGDFLARAGAGVGQSGSQQLVQRLLVQGISFRLQDGRCIGHQAVRVQLREDGVGRLRAATGLVDILDAYQPAPLMGACVQPAGQCGDQRTRVQRAGGGGGETADVHGAAV